MYRNTPSAQTVNDSKRHVAGVCWSSEWSFVEDAHIAQQKPVLPATAKKQPAGNHAGGSSKSW